MFLCKVIVCVCFNQHLCVLLLHFKKVLVNSKLTFAVLQQYLGCFSTVYVYVYLVILQATRLILTRLVDMFIAELMSLIRELHVHVAT